MAELTTATNLGRAFNGRSVLVTGHTGFKGSWLCLWLQHLGANVSGYALEPPTDPSNFETCGVREVLADHHQADIRDERSLTAALRKAKPDVVFHLAAQSIVRKSYQVPHETFDVNVMGTVNLLDVIRKTETPCTVICVTSDKCYENREQVWGYREQDAMGEHDPYGGSKGAAELAIRSYRHSFFPPERCSAHGVKLASARAGNVIGGGDWTPDALIVDVVKSLVDRQPVRLRNPHALRPWQHVLQALSGYLTLAARLLESDDPRLCDGWNFGPTPGNELPVHRVADMFLQHWGDGSWIDESDPNQPHEATILRLAIDKALWQLGWRPGWDVDETLRRTAEWYHHYFTESGSMRAFTDQQIAAYQTALTPIDPSESSVSAIA